MKKLAYLFVLLFWLCVTNAFGQVFVAPDSWIEILYQADQYPEEIEWKIEDKNGFTVLESDTGVLLDDYELLEEYSEFIYSVNNPHILTITDSYGDGLSGSQWNGEDGWFLIRNACQDTIAFVEGDFGALYIDSLTIAPCAPPIYGCLDPVAVNYNPSAYFDDECIWPDCSGFNSFNASQQCNNNQTELIFEWLTNGIGPSCDVNQIHYGYDLEATPFVQSQFFQADVPVGATPPTTFPYTIWEVSYFNNNNNVVTLKAGGNFVTEQIPHFFFVKFESGNYSDTLWITPEACIAGCTDPTSPEFNPMANVDDGSCMMNNSECGPGETTINIVVTPDTYPGETSWELIDTISETVIAVSPNYNQTGVPVVTTVCVDSTMGLQFKLFDNFGDGLCGSCYGGVDGSVFIYDANCDSLLFSIESPDANFGYEASTTFGGTPPCAPPTPPSGCTDPGFVEYDPLAIVNDGSCLTPVILGCIDPTALNYDALANQQLITPNCDYTLRLTDGAGDGWFGSYVTIVQGSNVYGPFTVHSGTQEDFDLNLGSIHPAEIFFYTQGNSITTVNQCGIQLINSDGDVTFEVGTNPWTDIIIPFPFSYNAIQDCGNNCIPKVFGCMNPLAFNFDSLANVDDGSCYFTPGCTSPAYLEYHTQGFIADYDDGSCVTLAEFGCMDNTQFNYNEYATVQWTSATDQTNPCIPIVLGCMDPTALNFDPLANTNDFNCILPIYGCTDATAFNYDPLANSDNGSCIDVITGCTNPIALNYDASANTDDFSCILPIYGCMDQTAFNYDPLANSDNGSCIPVITGCTNPVALNYDANANTDDFSCVLPIYGCTDATAFNYNPLANTDNGSCEPYVYGCIDVNALNYDANANTDDGSCIPFLYGCTDSNALNYNALANTDDGSCIPVLLGCTDVDALNYNSLANTDDGSCIDVVEGCMDAIAFNFNPLANVDDGSCIAVVLGCTDLLAFNYNINANTDDGSCIPVVLGCTDATAFNYNANANTDNGSCVPVVFGCMDVDAFNYDPLANVDNGTCLGVVLGCINPTAINFNPLANTDDGSCINPVYGCTDSTMFNYNPLANTDNGTCIPFAYGCTNANALNYDPLANTDDGSCVLPIYGCTDSTMFNYNPLANVDNGSCLPFVYGCTDPLAYNYNPLANTTDNSCCLIAGCTDPLAVNYNEFACFDDNSCITAVLGCTDVSAYNYNPAANVSDSTACLYDAGCYGGPGVPYWLNDGCFAWVIDVDEYCCTNDWDPTCQSMYDYCQLGWPTSIPDISALGIAVYPNPTKDVLTIETRLDIQIEVHDLMGKLLIKTKNVNRLDLSDLSNGLYNLSIIHEEKRYNKQIIKQ